MSTLEQTSPIQNPNEIGSQKTVGCLCLAYLRLVDKRRNVPATAAGDEWLNMYGELCSQFTPKAISRKMEKLIKKGWVSSAGSPERSWITEKGYEVFKQLKGADVN